MFSRGYLALSDEYSSLYLIRQPVDTSGAKTGTLKSRQSLENSANKGLDFISQTLVWIIIQWILSLPCGGLSGFRRRCLSGEVVAFLIYRRGEFASFTAGAIGPAISARNRTQKKRAWPAASISRHRSLRFVRSPAFSQKESLATFGSWMGISKPAGRIRRQSEQSLVEINAAADSVGQSWDTADAKDSLQLVFASKYTHAIVANGGRRNFHYDSTRGRRNQRIHTKSDRSFKIRRTKSR